MRPAAELLAECGRMGIALSAAGNTVRYRPKAAMTPALLTALTESKADLLAILREREAAGRAPWPPSIAALVEEGRRPDLSLDRATAIVRRLSRYAETAGDPQGTARRLVTALNGN